MKFRKKPVVIDAVRFEYPENWVFVPRVSTFEGFEVKFDFKVGYYLEIPTLEGTMKALEGDWIITGVNGEKYPCKNDIFEKTYEPAQ